MMDVRSQRRVRDAKLRARSGKFCLLKGRLYATTKSCTAVCITAVYSVPVKGSFIHLFRLPAAGNILPYTLFSVKNTPKKCSPKSNPNPSPNLKTNPKSDHNIQE